MINVALDGPAGSGKSTVAKFLANKLNILYLDTGALYRAVALYALQNGVDVEDEKKVEKLLETLDLQIEYSDGKQITKLSDKDVSKEIRQNAVSNLASKISALKCVRAKLLSTQRNIAKSMDCILDGRDIGTTVLPDAEYKFFITASVDCRAKRRYNELLEKGEKVEFEQLKKEIEERDYRDSHREIAPLKKADDAVEIDTSDLNIEQVCQEVLKRIK